MMICSCVTQLGFLGTRSNKFNIFNLIWKKSKYFKKQCNRTKEQYFKALVPHFFFHIMFWCRKSKVDDVIFSSKNRTEDLLVARNEIMSSYYYYFSFFFLQILCTRFLRNGSANLNESFRYDRYWSELD